MSMRGYRWHLIRDSEEAVEGIIKEIKTVASTEEKCSVRVSKDPKHEDVIWIDIECPTKGDVEVCDLRVVSKIISKYEKSAISHLIGPFELKKK